MNKFAYAFLVVLFIGMLPVAGSAAPVTPDIPYQGKLTDPGGNPLTGSYGMTFTLYDVPSGGVTLSTDTHSVTATNGLFTTTITVTDPGILDGRALWLGVKVGTETEMTPRQSLQPVPYAFGLRPGARVQDAFFSSSHGGTSSSALNAAVNVSTAYQYNPGIVVRTDANNSYGLYSETQGQSSYGVYARTLGFFTPGIYAVTSGDSSAGMSAQTFGTGSDGFHALTVGDESTGVYAQTAGLNSPAVSAVSAQDVGVYGIGKTGGYFTTNQAGTTWPGELPAVIVSTNYSFNPGIRVDTSGYSSIGVSSRTLDNWSYGVHAKTYGDNSKGVDAVTYGNWSHGVQSYTTGNNSFGVVVYTHGDQGQGVYVSTRGDWSGGVHARTSGRLSAGVMVDTFGYGSDGVLARSNQSNGIYTMTNRSDHMYGLYTPDYIYAMGAQYPAADVAEFMPVTDAASPGTVLIIGEDGRLTPATSAYDTRVAGIVSTNPGVFLGTKEDGNEGEALIAVAGRVPCKVDATYDAIRPGDILTTSLTPGYAMKAEPLELNGRTFYPSGTILGKALGTLESGRGTIEVIVTLQ